MLSEISPFYLVFTMDTTYMSVCFCYKENFAIRNILCAAYLKMNFPSPLTNAVGYFALDLLYSLGVFLLIPGFAISSGFSSGFTERVLFCAQSNQSKMRTTDSTLIATCVWNVALSFLFGCFYLLPFYSIY